MCVDLEDQLNSRDEVIYQLKQEKNTLVQINNELKIENEVLRSQISPMFTMKDEGMCLI